MKTVALATRLKLSESANFTAVLIKFKPPSQVAYYILLLYIYIIYYTLLKTESLDNAILAF